MWIEIMCNDFSEEGALKLIAGGRKESKGVLKIPLDSVS